VHIGYEQLEPYDLDEVPTSSITDPTIRYRDKMRFGTGKDRTTIIYNAHLRFAGATG
jgi:predicted helicase